MQVFHLINRWGRRSYLCGQGRRLGKDYLRRKEWIHQRLEELSGIFGLDTLGLAVMGSPSACCRLDSAKSGLGLHIT